MVTLLQPAGRSAQLGAIMIRRKRHNHMVAFKARMAQAVLKEEEPLAELAQRIDVHANLIAARRLVGAT